MKMPRCFRRVLPLAGLAVLLAAGAGAQTEQRARVRQAATEVHTQANATSPVKLRLNAGDIVSVLAERGEWLLVAVPDKGTGYVSRAAVEPVAAAPTLAAAPAAPVRPAADRDFVEGVEQVQAGAFGAAAVTLDGVVTRLQSDASRKHDLAVACLHLGVASLAVGQESRARDRFRQALAADSAATLDATRFAPEARATLARATALLDTVRLEQAGGRVARVEHPPAPTTSATSAPAKGKSKAPLILIGVGAVAAAGVAVAAGGGGDGGGASPQPGGGTTPSTPAAPTITFVSSSPSPGSTLSFSSRDSETGTLFYNMSLTFSVNAAPAVSGGTLRLSLLAGGCAAVGGAALSGVNLSSGQNASLTVTRVSIEGNPGCPQPPYSVNTVRAQLMSGSQTLLQQDFPLSYTFR